MWSLFAVASLAASLVSAYPQPQAPAVDSDYTKGFKKFTNVCCLARPSSQQGETNSVFQVTVYTPPQVAGEDTTSYGRTLILNHVSFSFLPST